jgi:hypothetical protein
MSPQTHINTGKTGAKRQQFHQTNPRTILLQLIAAHPHDTRQDEVAILELFWQKIHNNETILRTICEYWGVNNYRSIVYTTERSQLSRDAEVARTKETIVTKIALLDWKMPNGKALRECNRTDCKTFGGWLTKVAGKMKANETVGQKFSEQQLKTMMG